MAALTGLLFWVFATAGADKLLRGRADRLLRWPGLAIRGLGAAELLAALALTAGGVWAFGGGAILVLLSGAFLANSVGRRTIPLSGCGCGGLVPFLGSTSAAIAFRIALLGLALVTTLAGLDVHSRHTFTTEAVLNFWIAPLIAALGACRFSGV